MNTVKEIILVDENDKITGTCEKMEAHEKGWLHRAFSVFIFDEQGRLLLQQRADDKYHCGNLWANTCCSHPAPGEETAAAARRRLKQEMGFETELRKVFHFTYKAHFENGLTEHEFDHVYTGKYEGPVHPDPREVKDYRYLHLYKIREMLSRDPGQFAPWFRIAFPMIENWWGTEYRHLVA